MSCRRVFQIALVVLTGVLLACTGDTVTPTAPALEGIGTLTTEGKPPKPCVPWPGCKNDGDGDEPEEHSYSLAFAGVVSGGTDKGVNSRETEIRVKAGEEPDGWLDISKIVNVPGGIDDPGNRCFPAEINHAFTNVFSINNGSDYRVAYVFDAFADDGIKTLRYTLAMRTGSKPNEGENWLPDLHGDTTKLEFGSWEMVHSGRGGKKGACLGAGTFTSEQTVTAVHTGDSH